MGAVAGVNLGDRFLVSADTAPSRDAIVVDGSDAITLTYAELAARAERLAAALHERGVGAGDRVGVLLTNGNEHLEVLLASFLLRAIPVNIGLRDTHDEVRSLLDASRASFLVHEPGVDAHGRPSLERGTAYELALAEAGPLAPVTGRSGDDHYLLFTGGTTERPKGVLWRHEDLYRGALAAAGDEVRTRRGVRCLPASPFAHGTGQWMALTTLLHGGTVVCRRDRRFDPEALLDTIDAQRVSYLVIVGDAFAVPLVEVIDACPGRWDLLSLTVVLSGGAPLTAPTKAELLRLLPTALVVDGFGASETGGQGRMVSVPGTVVEGPPRFAVEDDTAVLDDSGAPLAPGDEREGRLARRGPIPVGYDGDDDATSASFPVLDGVRWALSGDRARVEPDGTVSVLGRGATTINTGGHKVQAEEVERTLRSHPSVHDVIVVGVPDDRFGERVAAVVSSGSGPQPTLDALRRHCADRIAPYKVPRHLVLVDEVQRSLAGKPNYAWARAVASA